MAGCTKTFEELLEEQLHLEAQKVKQLFFAANNIQPPIALLSCPLTFQTKSNASDGLVQKKKPHKFLRRGEGLAKYEQGNNNNVASCVRFSTKKTVPTKPPCSASSPRTTVNPLKRHPEKQDVRVNFWV